MLHCTAIALDSFVIFSSVFIDISKVIVSIAVAWIDLYRLFVPLNCTLYIIPCFEDNSIVIVGTVVGWVELYTLLIILASLVIFFYLTIANSHNVVDFIV